jgi:hypothetical protein
MPIPRRGALTALTTILFPLGVAAQSTLSVVSAARFAAQIRRTPSRRHLAQTSQPALNRERSLPMGSCQCRCWGLP